MPATTEVLSKPVFDRVCELFATRNFVAFEDIRQKTGLELDVLIRIKPQVEGALSSNGDVQLISATYLAAPGWILIC